MTTLENFDAALLGERLRVARTTANMTQEAAAKRVGVARTTIVAIERGERRVKASELVALARAYKTSVNGLLRPSSIHVDVQPQFRADGASSEAQSEAIQLLVRLATSYVELERAVGRPLRPLVPPEFPVSRGAALPQAEDAAMQLRATLGIGLAPVADVLRLAELQLGLRVFVRAVDSRIAGAYVFHPELGGCVLVNVKHPRPRRAWTIAHEIGHFLTARAEADILELGPGHHEDFADLFAGAFLMPPAALRRRFSEIAAGGGTFSPRDLILLAHEHQVSIEAMCRWLERLSLLPKQTYDALRDRGLDAAVVRSVVGDPAQEEPVPLPPRLMTIAAEAFYRGLVGEGQLSDMLGLDRLAVRELLAGIPDGSFDALK